MKNVFSAIVGLGVMTLGLGACATTASSEDRTTDTSENLSDVQSVETHGACDSGPNARFHCYAKVVTARTSSSGIRTMASHATPQGLGPSDLQAAYNLDATAGNGVTVAIIDAYGYKNALTDLNTYRKQYGIPAMNASGGPTLTVVNQEGNASPLPANPSSDDDWTVETALDLDMVSAACPKCNILLIQADDDQGDGLFIAQAVAAKKGAAVVSNSWGGSESAQNKATDSEHYFQGLGSLGIFVAAGDSGYDNGGDGADYPSTSAYVTAVGGTKLTKSGSTWTQTAWAGSASTGAGGSSCSLSIPKPAYQANVTTKCNFRAASDVAAIGDPASGPAIYNAGQWEVVGGTSAASPFTAAVYAATGHGGEAPGWAYSNTSAFHDVTSGKNGTCGNVLCNAGSGWDGPTGIGTPDGKKMAAISGGTNPNPPTPPTPPTPPAGDDDDDNGGTTNTCSHDMCKTGAKLMSNCSADVQAICKKDSYCCYTKWDATCVKEVASIAGASCN